MKPLNVHKFSGQAKPISVGPLIWGLVSIVGVGVGIFFNPWTDQGEKHSRTENSFQSSASTIFSSPFESNIGNDSLSQKTKTNSVSSTLLTQSASEQTLVRRAVNSKQPQDILIARLANRACLTASGASINPQRASISSMQKDSLDAVRAKCPDVDVARDNRNQLDTIVQQLPQNADVALLAQSGNIKKTDDQALAMKQALATGRPDLIAAIGAEDLSIEAYKQLGYAKEVSGSNPYDREMLAIAWQVWACQQANSCEIEAAAFSPCLSQGICSENLAAWPEENLYGPKSDYGYASSMNAHGFSRLARKQRWDELYALVNKITAQ